jgi:hypothetical protein
MATVDSVGVEFWTEKLFLPERDIDRPQKMKKVRTEESQAGLECEGLRVEKGAMGH